MQWTKTWSADGDWLRSIKSKPGWKYKVSRRKAGGKVFYAQVKTQAGWRPVEREADNRPKTYRSVKTAQAACEQYEEAA